jgi:hypothetical protein
VSVGRGLCCAATLGLLLLAAGCAPFASVSPQTSTPRDADVLAERWLRSVSGQSQDRGWTFLHPLSRSRLYGNNASAYVLEASSIDWSAFRWHVEPETHRDGNYLVTIALDGDRDPPRELAGGHLMQPFECSDGVHRAAITVRIDQDGTAGVLGP